MNCVNASRSACAVRSSGRRPCDRLRTACSSNIVTIETTSKRSRTRWRAAQLSLPPLQEIAARGRGEVSTTEDTEDTEVLFFMIKESPLCPLCPLWWRASESDPQSHPHRPRQRGIAERLH